MFTPEWCLFKDDAVVISGWTLGCARAHVQCVCVDRSRLFSL